DLERPHPRDRPPDEGRPRPRPGGPAPDRLLRLQRTDLHHEDEPGPRLGGRSRPGLPPHPRQQGAVVGAAPGEQGHARALRPDVGPRQRELDHHRREPGQRQRVGRLVAAAPQRPRGQPHPLQQPRRPPLHPRGCGRRQRRRQGLRGRGLRGDPL
ncbi:MAG: hypothetical protein AVDCRST_MAG20-1425, partial [uncultured Acidimicrobiales bacterium]